MNSEKMLKKLNDKLINNYTSKYLKPQDRILMSDRTYKKIEDLIIGDEIMGFDGKPHKITNYFNYVKQTVEIVK